MWNLTPIGFTKSQPGALPLILSLALLSACGSDRTLTVDLLTDLRGPDEFDRVRVRAFDSPEMNGEGRLLGQVSAPQTDSRGLLRAAEADDFPLGTWTVLVTLELAGAEVGQGRVIADIRSNSQAITVRVTRDCADVQCPLEGRPEHTACLGGQCVDPHCSPQTPEFCPPIECGRDTNCMVTSSLCLSGLCLAGICGAAPDDFLCGAGRICGPLLVCADGPSDTDGGAARLDASASGLDAGALTSDAGTTSTDAGPDAGTGAECVDSTDCVTRPAADCESPAQMRTYASQGTCAGGVCSYAAVSVPCAALCAAGACVACSGTCEAEPLVSGQVNPERVSLNSTHVYWRNRSSGQVMRQAKTGGAPEVFASGLEITAMAVGDAHLYWVNETGEEILRMDLGTREVGVAASTVDAWHLAVDDTHLYWNENVSSPGMYARPLGGGAAQLVTAASFTNRIAIDDTYIYWSNTGDDDISHVPKTGGSTDRLRSVGHDGQGFGVSGAYIYYSSGSDILRIPIAGGSGEVITTANAPRNVSVDETHIYWAEAGTGSVMRLSRCACGL